MLLVYNGLSLKDCIYTYTYPTDINVAFQVLRKLSALRVLVKRKLRYSWQKEIMQKTTYFLRWISSLELAKTLPAYDQLKN